jgi:glycerol-1-phosphatase
VATNTDRTLPSPRGALPGNGSLVATVATALGREPDVVVGKPEPGLFQAAAAQAGAHRPLVVGDRLDTDIAGARRAGLDSLLVLTGVSTSADLAVAPAAMQPTYVADDLSGLLTTPVINAR